MHYNGKIFSAILLTEVFKEISQSLVDLAGITQPAVRAVFPLGEEEERFSDSRRGNKTRVR
jgi:hypothetical protein